VPICYKINEVPVFKMSHKIFVIWPTHHTQLSHPVTCYQDCTLGFLCGVMCSSQSLSFSQFSQLLALHVIIFKLPQI